jgi:hypothetical protein
MIVTFLYRIRGVTGRSYGKYIGRPPSYEEGLDRGMASEVLLPLFQAVYPQQGLEEEDISVGILFVSRDTQDYYSEGEKEVFDVLYCHWPSGTEVFIEGKEVAYKRV